MGHPSALEYSSRPPVSVYGTDTLRPRQRFFLAVWNQTIRFTRRIHVPQRLGLNAARIYLSYGPYAQTAYSVRQLSYPPALPHRSNGAAWYRNLCACFPSPTPFGLGLGSDQPRAESPGPGNLRLSAGGILALLFVTNAGMISSIRSTRPYGHASTLNGMLPYHYEQSSQSAASVLRLAPLHLPRIIIRPVSYYALFK
eukprot:TRINITY_DN4824_c0_g2_i1.p1 TRINITY_DN4824_c0_g2~~TRINITY_DN4824_c0_g2_i1.p1  ORF type:complete len:198 (+),score=-51.14 TRINITY_DN4824_c0_g2_i1:552-1145(+)